MTKSNAGVVVPAIIACLLICALLLFTCKYCYNPRFLFRQRNSDLESASEKPPSGVVLSSEVVSVSSTSNVSGSLHDGIPVVEVQPDNQDTTVIAVAPGSPPVIEAAPPRSRFGLGGLL